MHSVWKIFRDELSSKLIFHTRIENEIEIETKPLATKTIPTQHNRLSQMTLCNQRKRKLVLKCEICSHVFRTSAELNAHQQQGCEGLMEIDSIAMDCKPTAVDFTNESHTDANDLIGIDHIDLDEQSEYAKSVNKNDVKSSSKHTKSTESPSTDKLQYKCTECGKKYASKKTLSNHRYKVHKGNYVGLKYDAVQIDGKMRFQCPLCDHT